MPQPFRFLSEADGLPKFEEALKENEKYTAEQLQKSPENTTLAAKLAILKHENKEELSELFASDKEKQQKNQSSNKLLNALRDLYETGDKELSPNISDVLETELPKGWYRNTALKFFYEKTKSPRAASLTLEREQTANDFRMRLVTFYTLRSLLSVLGFVAIFRFFSAKRLNSQVLEQEPRFFPFRNWYGCVLVFFETQFLLGMTLGIVLGFWLAVIHSSTKFSSLTPTVNAICAFVGASLFTISTNYLIFNLSDRQAVATFFAEKKLALRDFASTALGGFCSMIAILSVVRIIATLVPGMPVSTNNPIQKQAAEAFATPNGVLIAAMVVLICLWGPFFEEVIFRGLMYPWVRHKTSVLWGALITSVVFALCHMDLNGILYYIIMGLILNIVFEHKRNLLAAIAMHALWNSWVIATMVTVKVQ